VAITAGTACQYPGALDIESCSAAASFLDLLEEWMIPKPKTPDAYLGFPMRDLPGLVDFSWAVPLRMPI